MTRIRLSDISPDGVRIVVDWAKFVPGSSIFIPCINVPEALIHVKQASKLGNSDISWSYATENGTYGVRIWRIR